MTGEEKEEEIGDSPAYQLHLFMLRLWREPLGHQMFEWRGEVKYTNTGEVRYFRNGTSLYNAILLMLETSTPQITDAGTDPES